MSTQVIDAPVKVVGYQNLTSISSATKLTVPDAADFALITARDQAVAFRFDTDASSLTGSNGHSIAAGYSEVIPVDAGDVYVIEEAGNAAVVVTYYSRG